MHPLLHVVSVARDAMAEGRLWDAFAILGPDGEAACEFEHHYNRCNRMYRCSWGEIRVSETESAQDEEREPDYENIISLHKAYLRNRVEDISRREWQEPAKLSSFDAMLKEIYPSQGIEQLATQPNPLYNLIKKEPVQDGDDGINVRVRSWANMITHNSTAVIKE